MHRHARGFSLLELLIVMAIVGLTLGMVSLSASQNAQKDLQNDAQRIALLLQMARDEAIVRDRPVAFEADENHYDFLVKNDKDWEPISDDDLMRSREFKRAPVTLSMTPQPESSQNNGMLRIVFGREPVDKPFVLKLAQGDDAVSIQADGIGHFTVQ
ncbi:MAG TPA: type II secretion system minor pseudopilin GspH [Burkholderiaceae bacterium]